MQIHAAEITDVRKAVEREKLARRSLERRILPYRKGSHYQLPNRTTNNGEMKQHPNISGNDTALEGANKMLGTGVDENNVTELTVQHKTTLSEIRQLRTKIAESLGEHHDMKRSIDELKTEVFYIHTHTHTHT